MNTSTIRLKICILGSPNVGKTTTTLMYVHNKVDGNEEFEKEQR